jgi:hypothetical protein
MTCRCAQKRRGTPSSIKCGRSRMLKRAGTTRKRRRTTASAACPPPSSLSVSAVCPRYSVMSNGFQDVATLFFHSRHLGLLLCLGQDCRAQGLHHLALGLVERPVAQRVHQGQQLSGAARWNRITLAQFQATLDLRHRAIIVGRQRSIVEPRGT